MPADVNEPLRFDPEVITSWSRRADVWQVVAFMAACAERMLPNYVRFAEESGFGNPNVLRDAIDAAWRWLQSDAAEPNLEVLKQRCEDITPDTADHASAYTSAALDASVAATLLIEALQTGNKQLALDVSSLARDTVDLWVQDLHALDPQESDFEDRIRCDPLMQSELRAQITDIHELDEFRSARSVAVRSLLERVKHRVGGSLSNESV